MSDPTGLEWLLGDAAAEFLRTLWPTTHLHVKGGVDRFHTHFPEALQHIDSVLNEWSGEVRVYMPNLNDEFGGLDVSASAARALYGLGMGLSFFKADDIFPELQEYIYQIGAELGFPSKGQSRGVLYASPDGNGTAVHFDNNSNFILQLDGKKRWTLAPNPQFPFPLHRYSVSMPGPRAGLIAYAKGEAELRMPDDVIDVELSPGDVLFVPAGYWHWTEAVGSSLSLTIVYPHTTWADVVLERLRKRLTLDERWRAPALWTKSSEPELRSGALTQAMNLLAELSSVAEELTAEEVCAGSYRKAADVQVTTAANVIHLATQGATHELSLVGDYLEIFQCIQQAPDPFFAHDLLPGRDAAARKKIGPMLALLVETGFLQET